MWTDFFNHVTICQKEKKKFFLWMGFLSGCRLEQHVATVLVTHNGQNLETTCLGMDCNCRPLIKAFSICIDKQS